MDDYFEFMGLPRRLALDEGTLQLRYFELSRKYHPDFHAQADEQTRQLNLDRSSTLNRAYRTLKDPFERARYLVSLEWPDLPEAEKKRIPPSLLMEVMEMQEKVAESQAQRNDVERARLQGELEEIEQRLIAKMEGLRSELDGLAGTWDTLSSDADETSRRDVLGRLNQLLNTRNYLRTLISTIDAEVRGGEPVRH